MCHIFENTSTIKTMNALKLLGKICGVLFIHLGLWFLLFYFVFTNFFVTPNYLLESAKNNGLYEAAAEELIQTTIQEQGNEVSGVAISDDRFKNALQNVITPELLQSQAEIIVLATYDWLEGDTDRPTFTLNVNNQREVLAGELARLAAEELESLPVCTSPGQVQVNSSENIPTCKPPGFDLQETESDIKSALLNSADFFSETQISSEEIFNNDDNNQTQVNWQEGPRQFERAQNSWIFGIVFVAFGVGIVALLSGSRRSTVHLFSMQLLLVGLAVGVPAMVGLLIGSSFIRPPNSSMLETAGFKMLEEFGADMVQLLFVFAGVCIAIGLGGLLLTKRRKSQHLSDEKQPEEKVDNYQNSFGEKKSSNKE